MHEVIHRLKNMYMYLGDNTVASHSEGHYSAHLHALFDHLSETIKASEYELRMRTSLSWRITSRLQV